MLSGPRAKVSVLIAAYQNRDTIGETLEALRRQTVSPHQVIVVDSGGDGTVGMVRERYPEVDLIVSEWRLYPEAARNRGLARVDGDVLACLDADCSPDPDWVERIIEAADGYPALGGAVLNAEDSDHVGWAYFLSEFTSWLPGRPRTLRDTPTCNSAYRSGLVEEAGGFPDEPLLSADSLLHWRLRRRCGVSLRFDPRIRVRHRYRGTTRRLLARRFEHGRSLAAARRVFARDTCAPHQARGYVGRDAFSTRLCWAAAAFALLPPFYAARLVVHALGHAEVPVRAFSRALPLTLLALTLWAWGQAYGAVFQEEMS